MKIVLFDCDCVDMRTHILHPTNGVEFIPVSNHPNSLPRCPKGLRIGKTAPTFKNSSDFLLIYLLTKRLTKMSRSRRGDERHEITIVTKDRALIAAIHMVAKLSNARCYSYPRLQDLEREFYGQQF